MPRTLPPLPRYYYTCGLYISRQDLRFAAARCGASGAGGRGIAARLAALSQVPPFRLLLLLERLKAPRMYRLSAR